VSETSEKSQIIFETLNTQLRGVYEIAKECADTLSEDFSPAVYRELRDLQERYGQRVSINEGGMKRIFKVEDKTSGRFVAMALLKKNDSIHDNERFLREARLTATLEHPNIMPVYDIGINFEEESFFTMKLTGGENLSELLKKRFSDSTWTLMQRLTLFPWCL